MVALVTGGAGFIGRHLVALLVERGEQVRVLDIDPEAETSSLVEVVRGSVTDAPTVRRALRGVRRLYHLAGNPNLWSPNKADFDSVNWGGTRTVLREAARFDLERIVYTSTESILVGLRNGADPRGTNETVTRRLEDMPGPYCRSKFRAEQEALAAARAGLPLVIVNPTLPIGPGDRHLTPPTRMLLGFLKGQFPAYLDCRLNVIDVRDVALGHLLAAERGGIGQRYILGSANLSLRNLLERLQAISGAAMPRLRVPYPLAFATGVVSEFLADHVTHRPPNAPLTGVRLARQSMHFDCSKAARELGLPRRPIEDSLRDAVAWFVARGLLRRPLPKPAAPVPRRVRAAPCYAEPQ